MQCRPGTGRRLSSLKTLQTGRPDRQQPTFQIQTPAGGGRTIYDTPKIMNIVRCPSFADS